MAYAIKNKIQLIGTVGVIDILIAENGNKLAFFTLATNEKYINRRGEKVTETMFHKVVAVGKLADIVQKYIIKGKQLAVEGTLINTRREGDSEIVTEVHVTDMLMLGGN